MEKFQGNSFPFLLLLSGLFSCHGGCRSGHGVERESKTDKIGVDEWMDGTRVLAVRGLRRLGQERRRQGSIRGWHHRVSLERTRNTYPSLVQNSFLQFLLILSFPLSWG